MLVVSKHNVGDWVYIFKEEEGKAKEYRPDEKREATLLYQYVKISHIDISIGDTAQSILFSYYGYNKQNRYVWFKDYQVVKTYKDLMNIKCGNIFGKELDIKVRFKKSDFNLL